MPTTDQTEEEKKRDPVDLASLYGAESVNQNAVPGVASAARASGVGGGPATQGSTTSEGSPQENVATSQPAVPSSNGAAAVPQNTDGPVPRPSAPALPGALANNVQSTTSRVSDDEKDKNLELKIKELQIKTLFDIEKENREDARWRIQHADKMAEVRASQRRPWRFTATMNGITGRSNFNVEWLDDNRESTSVSQEPVASSDGKSFADKLYDIVNGGKKKSAASKPSQSTGLTGGPREPLDESWLPKDTLTGDKRTPLKMEDFTGRVDGTSTGRFAGGFLGKEFEENYKKSLIPSGLTKEQTGRYQQAADERWKWYKRDLQDLWERRGVKAIKTQEEEQAKAAGRRQAAKAGETVEDVAKYIVDNSKQASSRRVSGVLGRTLNRRP